MKSIIPAFLLALTLLSAGCKKAHSFCGVNNAATDLPWVRHLIADHGSDSIRIYEVTYNSHEGILVSNANGSQYFNTCDSVPVCSYSSGGGIASGVWVCSDGGQFKSLSSTPVLIYAGY